MRNHSVYDSQVFSALGKFKSVRNWPGLNSCLQNILDVFQSFPDVKHVPHKILFSKTLSQCLAPTLPAGIQSKTLDVYMKVFSRYSEAALIRDFYLWAPGLLQFFHSAGVAQRITTLKSFDEYFVPLVGTNERIAPPIILSILPGLTDEGTELPGHIGETLEKLKQKVGVAKFWSSMCRAALTSPVTRLPFLKYALKAQVSDVVSFGNSELLMRMFTVLFSNPNPLVIRSSLDLFKAGFSLFEKHVKLDLGYKCLGLLENDDLSIRRRVFNWMTAFSSDALESLAFAPAGSVRIALERGGEVKAMVLQCLPTLLADKDFDISSIKDLIDPDVLLIAGKGNFSAQLRILKQVLPTQAAKSEVLESVLAAIPTSCDFDNVCVLGRMVVDAANQTHVEEATRAVEYIFENRRDSAKGLDFVSKIIVKLHLRPDFASLLKEPITFITVKTLVNLSKGCLEALVLLDDTSQKFAEVCWTALLENNMLSQTFDICKTLIAIYHIAPASFAVGLDKCWHPKAVKLFVNSTSEIPMSLVMVCQKKNAESEQGDSELLRMITSHAQLLISDLKRLVSNDDPSFTRAVVSSVQQLIDDDANLFVSSITEGTLVELVRVLINVKGTSRLIYSILTASENEVFLSTISETICDYVLEHPHDVCAHISIVPVAKHIRKLPELIRIVPASPHFLSSLLRVLDQLPSSQEHFEAIRLTCATIIQILETTPLDEPLMYDISFLFRLITKRIQAEMVECRASMKSSTIRRLLTTIDELSSNDCVASLTVRHMPDYSAVYSSLTPDYLPCILSAIWKGVNQDSASRLLVPFFASFDSIWKLFLFFAVSIANGLQDDLLIACLLPLVPEDQLIENIRNLVVVLSYDDKADRQVFMRFMSCLVASRAPSLVSEEAVSVFSSMFHTLHIPPLPTIAFICDYISTFPIVAVSSFQAPFTNAVTEVKSNQDELRRIVSFLCDIDANTFSLIFDQKPMVALVKLFALCDKTSVEYPKLIARFGVIDDAYGWIDCVVAMLSDPKLFSYGKPYLSQALRAINVVSKRSDRLVTQILELLCQKSEVFWKFGTREFTGIERIRILAFVILGCDFDLFSNRQQSINSLLAHSLSLENTGLADFRAFSLLMRVMFVRLSQKSVESFSSILVNELIEGLSGTKDIRMEAERLISAAISTIPSSFQFMEFAFLPDLITFSDEELSPDSPWPMLKDSTGSLQYLSRVTINKEQYEALLLSEFVGFSLED